MNNPPSGFTVVRGLRKDRGPRLAETLRRLKQMFGAVGIKLSTEDAGMNLEQIHFWTGRCRQILPVTVKIGGPNARNDIKQLLALHVDGLIAPMVESPYGLENFMDAVRDFTTPLRFGNLKKQINVETVTAVNQLDDILECPAARWLDGITIGCSDLCRSMKTSRDDPAVLTLVKHAIRKIQAKGILVSVGGGITPDSIDAFLKAIQPDQFNTRVITFDAGPRPSFRPAVRESLEFEIQMLAHDCALGFISRDEEVCRAGELKKRLG